MKRWARQRLATGCAFNTIRTGTLAIKRFSEFLSHCQPPVTQPSGIDRALLERYARRMNIEQRLAESIWSFHTDALAGSVPLNVDLDVALTVLAGAVCAALRRRLTGYHHATPDTLQRRFLSTTGTIDTNGDTITVHLDRRTYSPVLRQADLPDTTIPWWGNRTLHFEYR